MLTEKRWANFQELREDQKMNHVMPKAIWIFTGLLLFVGFKAQSAAVTWDYLAEKTKYSTEAPDQAAFDSLSNEDKSKFIKRLLVNSLDNIQNGKILGAQLVWLTSTDFNSGLATIKNIISRGPNKFIDAQNYVMAKVSPDQRKKILEALAPEAFSQDRPDLLRFMLGNQYQFDFKALMLNYASACDAAALYKIRLYTNLDPRQATNATGKSVYDLTDNPGSAKCVAARKILGENRDKLLQQPSTIPYHFENGKIQNDDSPVPREVTSVKEWLYWAHDQENTPTEKRADRVQ